jgi:hydrogenase expression/formation protein HypC
MCLAIPAKILSIDGFSASVDIAGIVRTASLRLTPDATVGDYVLLHTGYAISLLSAEEAADTLATIREAAALIAEEDA